MPELDGISLCKLIKSQKALKKTRTIRLSSKTFEADQEKPMRRELKLLLLKILRLKQLEIK